MLFVGENIWGAHFYSATNPIRIIICLDMFGCYIDWILFFHHNTFIGLNQIINTKEQIHTLIYIYYGGVYQSPSDNTISQKLSLFNKLHKYPVWECVHVCVSAIKKYL